MTYNVFGGTLSLTQSINLYNVEQIRFAECRQLIQWWLLHAV